MRQRVVIALLALPRSYLGNQTLHGSGLTPVAAGYTSAGRFRRDCANWASPP